MKLFTTDRFTTEEHQQFLTAYRKLLELVPSQVREPVKPDFPILALTLVLLLSRVRP